jgi:hypothetical protein
MCITLKKVKIRERIGLSFKNCEVPVIYRGHNDGDHMVFGFTTTYAIRPPITTQIESYISPHGEVDLIHLYVMGFVSGPATSLWFSLGTPAFFTNKTDSHDITLL